MATLDSKRHAEDRTRALGAIAGAAAFLVLLASMHGLAPELDPAHRMISEYAVGRYGWVMQLAFVCLGASMLALRAALRRFLPRPSVGLAVMAAALLGAAVFRTDLLTQPPPHGVSHGAHQLCGSVVILGFPVLATLLATRLSRAPAWAAWRPALRAITAATWLGQTLFFAAVRLSGRPPAGAVGWPNRVMMLCYCAWIIAVAHRSVRSDAPDAG
jgi:hypothetical protein